MKNMTKKNMYLKLIIRFNKISLIFMSIGQICKKVDVLSYDFHAFI